MGQRCPRQRKTERLPHDAEDEEIEIPLTPLPVRAVEDEHQIVLIPEKPQDEAGHHRLLIRPLKLDEALEALVDGLVGADETNAHHQLEQADGAFFDDGENQRGQNGEATGVKRKVGGQERTESILRQSAPGVLHRRKHRTGTVLFSSTADF